MVAIPHLQPIADLGATVVYLGPMENQSVKPNPECPPYPSTSIGDLDEIQLEGNFRFDHVRGWLQRA